MTYIVCTHLVFRIVVAVGSNTKSVWTFDQNRQFLPTQELYEVVSKFGNITPAFNNNYDVSFNLSSASQQLKGYISERSFYKDEKGLADAGQYLSLFCSEAVLPGSRLDVFQRQGIRQGVNQKFAAYRQFPEIILTWYSQKDYYTNDVFNSWMEFISPNIDVASSGKYGSYRKLNYPKSYKVDMQVTAFSKDTTDRNNRLTSHGAFSQQQPSSITYHIVNAFPVNIVAAPLAYGKAELVKTTITFAYDMYDILRSSRVGGGVASTPQGIMPPIYWGSGEGGGFTESERPVLPPTSEGTDQKEKKPWWQNMPNVGLGVHHWSGSSDIRLKENIVKVGRSPSGLNIYEWNYIWGSPRYSGVMAQEIINIIPEAVVTMPNGYLGVNYAKIDVDMLAK
tara:strand:+ start:1 stop:1182 length:1182 start_codon:yes stop_codon:yes gene_type:complete